MVDTSRKLFFSFIQNHKVDAGERFIGKRASEEVDPEHMNERDDNENTTKT